MKPVEGLISSKMTEHTCKGERYLTGCKACWYDHMKLVVKLTDEQIKELSDD